MRSRRASAENPANTTKDDLKLRFRQIAVNLNVKKLTAMRSTNSCTSQDGICCFGHLLKTVSLKINRCAPWGPNAYHRHIDTNAVPAANTEAFQNIRKATDFVIELLIRDLLDVIGVISFIDNGNLIGTSRQMAIDRVITRIDDTIVEPRDITGIKSARFHFCIGREESNLFFRDL